MVQAQMPQAHRWNIQMYIHRFAIPKQQAILPAFSPLQPRVACFPLKQPQLAPLVLARLQLFKHRSNIYQLALRLEQMIELAIQRAPQIHSHPPFQQGVGGPLPTLGSKLAILAAFPKLAEDSIPLFIATALAPKLHFMEFKVRC